jgi:hypothetical protein
VIITRKRTPRTLDPQREQSGDCARGTALLVPTGILNLRRGGG